jgi:hypothetical protein
MGYGVIQSTNRVLYPRGHSGAMSLVHCHSSLQIVKLLHDLRVLLAKTRDEETTKTCGPCARAL